MKHKNKCNINIKNLIIISLLFIFVSSLYCQEQNSDSKFISGDEGIIIVDKNNKIVKDNDLYISVYKLLYSDLQQSEKISKVNEIAAKSNVNVLSTDESSKIKIEDQTKIINVLNTDLSSEQKHEIIKMYLKKNK